MTVDAAVALLDPDQAPRQAPVHEVVAPGGRRVSGGPGPVVRLRGEELVEEIGTARPGAVRCVTAVDGLQCGVSDDGIDPAGPPASSNGVPDRRSVLLDQSMVAPQADQP